MFLLIVFFDETLSENGLHLMYLRTNINIQLQIRLISKYTRLRDIRCTILLPPFFF